MERLVLWHRVFPPARVEQDMPGAVQAWLNAVDRRLHGSKGTRLQRVGGSVAHAFDLTELSEALDHGLTLLDEAEELEIPEGGLHVAIGAATGPVERSEEGFLFGHAIDRAQLLANRARRGELVVDHDTRELASSEFLFARSVGTGAAALRGSCIDRGVPHRATCRLAIARLAACPVAPATEQALAPLRSTAERSEGTDAVALRGPSGAGADGFLRSLEARLEPSLVLRIAGVAAGLEPRGSLRLALHRSVGTLAASPKGSVLGRVRLGEAVPFADVETSLKTLLQSASKRAWIILDPIPSIDSSTLELLDATVQTAPALVIARLPIDATLPTQLHLPWSEYMLPVLRLEDAKAVARVIAGDEGGDVARRIGVLGGDTPLGVAEAARTLVAAGDLVHDGTRFVWRNGPRAGIDAIPVENLLLERLSALEQQPLRMLEAVCVAPAGTPRPIIAAIAASDGLSESAREAATRRLENEALIEDGSSLLPASETLRRLILRNLQPARAAELNRYIATVMSASPLCSGPLARASFGWHLCQGGDAEAGAAALLEAANAALTAGHRGGARQLALSAVQMDDGPDTRAEASRVTHAARGPDGDGDPLIEGRVSDTAVSALLAGDIARAERTIESAIAGGGDLAAADRMRVMALLARGETSAAMSAYARLRQRGDADERQQARAALTLSWILLHSGSGSKAIRQGLEALMHTRRLKDPRGEAAALHTIAAAYRSLGRPEDAERISDASPA